MLWRVKRHPLAIYLTLEGALSLLMSLYGTVTTVYRVQAAGLNPLQLTLVGTALEGSIFVLQIPTGALALALCWACWAMIKSGYRLRS